MNRAVLFTLATGLALVGAAQLDYSQEVWDEPVLLNNRDSGFGISQFVEANRAVKIRLTAEQPVHLKVYGWGMDKPVSESEALLFTQAGVTDASLTLPLPRSALWEVAIQNGVNEPNLVTELEVRFADRTTNLALASIGGAVFGIGASVAAIQTLLGLRRSAERKSRSRP